MGTNRMTPFAQLAPMMLKRAGTQPFPFAPQYMPGRVPQPMPTPGPEPAAPAEGGGWGWKDTGGLALDVAAGSNPFTGVPYYGYKAIKDFSDGNIWSGIGNIGWGALSFLPGAASVGKGIVGGATRGIAKMTPGVIKSMQTGAKLTPGMAKGLGIGGATAGIGSIAGGMLTGEGAPQQQPQQQPMMPQAPQPQPGFIDGAIDTIRNQGLPTR